MKTRAGYNYNLRDKQAHEHALTRKGEEEINGWLAYRHNGKLYNKQRRVNSIVVGGGDFLDFYTLRAILLSWRSWSEL